jgi:prepilin-type processing-associated H-X9-DG protein
MSASPIQRRSPGHPALGKPSKQGVLAPWPSSAGYGFSLVELLVVIGLVTSLAGLLLPALTKARRAAATTRCSSNLKQLGLAAQLYWDDFNGRAFTEGYTSTNGGKTYWFGWLQDGAEGQREFDPRAGKLWPYLQGRGVETCPALNRASPAFKNKARGAAYGYGYNLYIGPRDPGGTGATPPVSIEHLAAPCDLALFADCGQINDFQAPASPDHPMLEEFYFFETTYASIHFRHGQRAETLFVDGHAGLEKPEPGSEDDRLAGQLTGRLTRNRVVPQ